VPRERERQEEREGQSTFENVCLQNTPSTCGKERKLRISATTRGPEMAAGACADPAAEGALGAAGACADPAAEGALGALGCSVPIPATVPLVWSWLCTGL